MSKATPVVFVVDADVPVRESVEQQILKSGLRAEVFGAALDFLAHPVDPSPCCLLLEASLPDMHGLELQRRVAAERSEMPIIFITSCQDVVTTVRAMKAGALEFLTKPFDPGELMSAVRKALERSCMIIAREAELRALRERQRSLTRRENEIMTLVVSGRLNKQVGGELGISEITVKAHRGRVMRKMQAKTLAHLIDMATKLRLTVAPEYAVQINTRSLVTRVPERTLSRLVSIAGNAGL